jgi:hypothetical protein
MNKVKQQFEKWNAEAIPVHGNIPNDQHVIIRLFRFEPEHTGVVIEGLDGENLVAEQNAKLLNIAKVLAVGKNSSYKVGDLCCLPDYYFQSQINPVYVEFQEMLKERPAPEVKAFPPKYILRLSTDMEKYVMLLDKFSDEVTNADKLTYCVPEGIIRNRYDYSNTEEHQSTGTEGRTKSKKMESVLSETT